MMGNATLIFRPLQLTMTNLKRLNETSDASNRASKLILDSYSSLFESFSFLLNRSQISSLEFLKTSAENYMDFNRDSK